MVHEFVNGTYGQTNLSNESAEYLACPMCTMWIDEANARAQDNPTQKNSA